MEKVLINPQTKEVVCYRNLSAYSIINFLSPTRVDYFGKRTSIYANVLSLSLDGKLGELNKQMFEKEFPGCIWVDYDACSNNILYEQRFCSH